MSWVWALVAALAVLAALRERRRRIALRDELEALALRGESMRRVLDHLDEGALLLGAQDAVLYANPAALHLLGAQGEVREGESRLEELVRGPEVRAAVAAHRGGTERRLIDARTADGDPLALELTVAPAGAGRRLVVLRDVRVSETVERKRRDFVANASHELKTPIAALIGLLDLMDLVPPGKREDLMARARRNAQSLAQMAEDLLGLARAEDPDWRPSPREIDVAEVLQRVRATVETSAREKGLALSVHVDPQPFALLVDPVCLETVVRNLVQNAINYTPSGKVDVRVIRAPGIGARIEVTDTGPGIDPKILPRIFERFFRGDPAHSRATGGTGLGLSIVRNLVNRMGGRIAVDSVPGEGSEFRVELPEQPSRPLPGARSPLP